MCLSSLFGRKIDDEDMGGGGKSQSKQSAVTAVRRSDADETILHGSHEISGSPFTERVGVMYDDMDRGGFVFEDGLLVGEGLI